MFGRIRYSQGWWDKQSIWKSKIKAGELWILCHGTANECCASLCEGLCCMHPYLTVRVSKHPGENFTEPLQLNPTADKTPAVSWKSSMTLLTANTPEWPDTDLRVRWFLSKAWRPSRPSFLSDQLALAQRLSTWRKEDFYKMEYMHVINIQLNTEVTRF